MKTGLLSLAFTALLAAPTGAWASDDDSKDETKRTRVKVPFVFDVEKENTDFDVEFIDVPFVEGGKYSADNGHKHVELLDVPFASFLKVHEDDGHSEMKFLNLPGFSLVRAENDNGDYDRKFLKLPIVGSLYRQKKEGDKKTTKFLFFFRHTRDVEPDHRDYEEIEFEDVEDGGTNSKVRIFRKKLDDEPKFESTVRSQTLARNDIERCDVRVTETTTVHSR